MSRRCLVRTLSGTQLCIDISSSSKVREVKDKVAEVRGYNGRLLRLVWRGRTVGDEEPVDTLQREDQDRRFVAVGRPRGCDTLPAPPVPSPADDHSSLSEISADNDPPPPPPPETHAAKEAALIGLGYPRDLINAVMEGASHIPLSSLIETLDTLNEAEVERRAPPVQGWGSDGDSIPEEGDGPLPLRTPTSPVPSAPSLPLPPRTPGITDRDTLIINNLMQLTIGISRSQVERLYLQYNRDAERVADCIITGDME